MSPAPPKAPAPIPARLPFCWSSSWASWSSWRTSVAVCSEACWSSSLRGRSLCSLLATLPPLIGWRGRSLRGLACRPAPADPEQRDHLLGILPECSPSSQDALFGIEDKVVILAEPLVHRAVVRWLLGLLDLS